MATRANSEFNVGGFGDSLVDYIFQESEYSTCSDRVTNMGYRVFAGAPLPAANQISFVQIAEFLAKDL